MYLLLNQVITAENKNNLVAFILDEYMIFKANTLAKKLK